MNPPNPRVTAGAGGVYCRIVASQEADVLDGDWNSEMARSSVRAVPSAAHSPSGFSAWMVGSSHVWILRRHPEELKKRKGARRGG